MRKSFNTLMILLSVVSSITTWMGLVHENRLADSMIQRDIIPLIGGIGTLCIAVVFWLAMFKRYPQVYDDLHRKLIFKRLIIPLGCAFIFCASTIYSIIGIAGYPAITMHMNESVSSAEVQLGELSAQIERENNLVTPLQMYSTQFASLADMESRQGVTTGFVGYGNVTIQLQSLSKTLSNLEDLIRKSTSKRKEKVKDASGQIVELKQLISDVDVNMEQKLATFGRKLVDLNQTLQEIGAEISQVVKEGVKQLEEMSATSGPTGNNDLAKAQNNARARLTESIDGAKKTLGKFVSQAEGQDRRTTKILENISMSSAVIRYWSLVLPQIALSIALDFVPLVLLLILVTTKKEEEEDENTERKTSLQDRE